MFLSKTAFQLTLFWNIVCWGFIETGARTTIFFPKDTREGGNCEETLSPIFPRLILNVIVTDMLSNHDSIGNLGQI